MGYYSLSCTFSPFIYTVNPYTKQSSVSSITSLSRACIAQVFPSAPSTLRIRNRLFYMMLWIFLFMKNILQSFLVKKSMVQKRITILKRN